MQFQSTRTYTVRTSGGRGPRTAPVTVSLLAVMVAVYAAQAVLWMVGADGAIATLSSFTIVSGNATGTAANGPWTLVTYALFFPVPAAEPFSLMLLALATANGLMLAGSFFYAGAWVERRWGGFKMAGFFLSAVVAASLLPAVAGQAGKIPFSGPLGGILALFVVVASEVGASPVSRRFTTAQFLLIWSILLVFYGVMLDSAAPPRDGRLGYMAHGVGAFFAGMILGLKPRAVRHFEVMEIHRELRDVFAEEELKEDVDAILEKIATHGFASLTRGEAAYLERASRRFKQITDRNLERYHEAGPPPDES